MISIDFRAPGTVTVQTGTARQNSNTGDSPGPARPTRPHLSRPPTLPGAMQAQTADDANALTEALTEAMASVTLQPRYDIPMFSPTFAHQLCEITLFYF